MISNTDGLTKPEHESGNPALTIETMTPVEINKNPPISMLPSMEATGIAVLRECLSAANVFLEYGAGGSTMLAGQVGVEVIISTESDKKYSEAVAAEFSSRFAACRHIPCYVDIGPTQQWGHPVDRTSAHKWPNYCSSPWIVAARHHLSPDLVLIDGRFRVSCCLATLVFAKPNTVILFDDYVDRGNYHIVEKYCAPLATHGRMAQFTVSASLDVHEVILDLLKYSTNPA
jgi:hypothetical protein